MSKQKPEDAPRSYPGCLWLCAAFILLLAVAGCSVICPEVDCIPRCVGLVDWINAAHDRISPLETAVPPLEADVSELRATVAALVGAPSVQVIATPEPRLVLEGMASWVSDALVGSNMRNGLPYDREAATCAVDAVMWDDLQGAVLTVCATRCVTCTVTDSGYLLEAGVAIDLSPRVFSALAPLGQGVVSVKVWR